MRFNVSKQEISKSNIPHEIFLTNLIGNHFLMSIAVGELFHVYPRALVVVPAISILLMGYTFWRAYRSRRRESWYIMSHWQIAVRHTKIFIFAQCLLVAFCLMGWMAFHFGGLTKVAAIAFVGGCAGLPMFMVMLILILLESQALYQANQRQLPRWVVAAYSNAGGEVSSEDPKVRLDENQLSPHYVTD